MADKETSVADLKDAVRSFVHERDWEKYHNPKDLAESICIEAAELLQLFQWVSPVEVSGYQNDPSKQERVKEELADVLIYCLSMANTMKIDLTTTIMSKLETNKKKYPKEQYRGKAP